MRDEPEQVPASAAGRQTFQKSCVRQMPMLFSHSLWPQVMKPGVRKPRALRPGGVALPCGSGLHCGNCPYMWAWLSHVGVALSCGNCPHLWEWPYPVGVALACGNCLHLWEWPLPVGAAFTCGSSHQQLGKQAQMGRHPKHTQRYRVSQGGRPT